MPLLPGKANVGRNIAELQAHDHPHKQAVAIALKEAGESKNYSAAGDNQTVEIRNWPVFASGTHKETAEFFSPKAIKQIGENFARLSHLPVVGKLGHDREQRYRESLGLPAAGRVASLHVEPDGTLVFDRVVNIPRIIGSAIVSGFLPGVSIELAPRQSAPGRRMIRDPNDPSAPIDGDILTGFAFLGEELPAVPGYETPTPTFPDGSPVPPLTDEEQRWWLEKMAPYLSTPAGNAPDKDDANEYAGWSVAFSAYTFTPARQAPVDPQAIIAALQALPPEQQQQVLAAVQPAPAAPPPPEESPAFKAFAEQFKAFTDQYEKDKAETAKCMGAMQEKLDADQKREQEAEMSAYAVKVDAVYDRNDNRKRLTPVEWQAKRELGLNILTSKTFSAAADRDAAFSAWEASISALPINLMLKDQAADTHAGQPAVAGRTPNGRAVLAALADVAPNVHKRLTAAK